jgi:catechol 2,3-dioxygenase-like lactoylglutathione lyase family enzyme
MMISGAHMIIYSADAEADRAFFRDVLSFPSVDAGHGWLIFALPPAEIAFHPVPENGQQEIYLMCDDVTATIETLERQNVKCDPVIDQRWGLLTHLSLPGGGKLGLYQPKHPIAARKDETRSGA